MSIQEEHEHPHGDHEHKITREELFKQLNKAYQEADVVAVEKLSRAGIILVCEQPFFATVYALLRKVPTMAIPTLATDGMHIFYNPFYVQNLDQSHMPAALAHECGHVVFDTMGRQGHRDKDRWNCAADFVINDIMKEAGFKLAEGWLYDPKYQGMSAEQVYELLEQQEKKEGKGGKGSGGNGGDHEHCGGVLDPAPPEEVPPHMKPEQIAVRAAMAAKAAGKLPGSLESLLDDIINPKLDWKKQLRNFVSVNNKDNYTWQKPNRRYIMYRTYLPTLHGHEVGECAVIFDTSGSVSDEECQAFLSEMSSILRDARPKKIHFIQCDAAIQSHQELTPQDLPLKGVKIKGRGGTSFHPPFKHIREKGINPKFCVFMTDGYPCDGYPDAPNYPVMWVTTGGEGMPWGEVLKLDLTK